MMMESTSSSTAGYRSDSESLSLIGKSDDEDLLKKLSRCGSIPTLMGPITLSWDRLSVFVPRKKKLCRRDDDAVDKQILFNVSGCIKPGQLVALMGASGAGKTTLLNMLTQRNVRGVDWRGSIRVNGEEIGRAITAISAYVQQDDLFIGTLTVREHLIFQAMLRLPNSLTNAEKQKRAEEVLKELGLKECANTRIGISHVKRGISGGEAKRLAFASEILTNPPLLFCDEPTTGLDSYMAQSVVKVLLRLASKGKTVLCTIHQPASEVYSMFNRVVLLAEGRTAFFGITNEALSFFKSAGYACPKNYNPADFYIQTLAVVPGKVEECKSRIKAVCDKYDESEYAEDVYESISTSGRRSSTCSLYAENFGKKSPYKASWFLQFICLFWRSTLDNYRNWQIAFFKTVEKVVLGLFVGLMYSQTVYNQQGISNINGALYFMLAEFTFPALFGILNTLPSDYLVLVREHHNGMYKINSYYISKIISFIPVYTVDGMVYLTIAYYMIGLRNSARAFFTAIGIGVLVEQTSCAFGMMISAVSPSFPVALIVSGPILMLIQMTGGLFANVSTLPAYLSWIQYLSWFRYGFEAFAINQWATVTNITCSSSATGCKSTGDMVLESLGFSSEYLTRDCLMMLVLMLVYYIVGYIAMWIRTYRAR